MASPEHERPLERAPGTEQIAAAGAVGQDRTSPGQHPLGDRQPERPASATQAAAGSDVGGGDRPSAQLLADDELQSMLVRWKDIQAAVCHAHAYCHAHA